MSRMRFRARIEGTEELADALDGLRAAVRNRILRQEVRKLASAANKTARGRLGGARTGQLKKSVGYVYRSYRNRTVWVYVVGPRRGFAGSVGALGAPARKRAEKSARRFRGARGVGRGLTTQKVDPLKYGHLVEGGRRGVAPTRKKVMSGAGVGIIGKRAKPVAAAPFMAPAAAAVAGMQTELLAGVLGAIEREAAKVARRGRSIYR